ncbi:MAG: hypothetical protein ACLUFL_01900 [Flavonifractor plautii]
MRSRSGLGGTWPAGVTETEALEPLAGLPGGTGRKLRGLTPRIAGPLLGAAWLALAGLEREEAEWRASRGGQPTAWTGAGAPARLRPGRSWPLSRDDGFASGVPG